MRAHNPVRLLHAKPVPWLPECSARSHRVHISTRTVQRPSWSLAEAHRVDGDAGVPAGMGMECGGRGRGGTDRCVWSSPSSHRSLAEGWGGAGQGSQSERHPPPIPPIRPTSWKQSVHLSRSATRRVARVKVVPWELGVEDEGSFPHPGSRPCQGACPRTAPSGLFSGERCPGRSSRFPAVFPAARAVSRSLGGGVVSPAGVYAQVHHAD